MDNLKIQEEKKFIYDAVDKILNENGKKIINYDNLKIGDVEYGANLIGCIRKQQGWYGYTSDEKMSFLFNGPFSTNGVVCYIALKTGTYSNKLANLMSESDLINLEKNAFYDPKEIDEYENSDSEKVSHL